MQNFYIHSKGWYVLHPIDPVIAKDMASRMKYACNNRNIGYDQSGRQGVVQKGTHTQSPTEADCSSLIRACVKEASGIDPGDFNTGNEVEVLEKSGLFETHRKYVQGAVLYEGDILVTCTKGHTVMVVDGYPREIPKKSIGEIAREVIDGKWGAGSERVEKLTKAGYDYVIVQKEVNAILSRTNALNTIASSFKKGSRYETCVDALNVRKKPNGDIKCLEDFSEKFQKKCNVRGQVLKGSKVKCKKAKVVDDEVWLRIPSGWVCAYTKNRYFIKNEEV